MPKLCQCRRKKLLDRLWDIPDPYKDLVDQQLEDIEKILESDCVCEKKEFRQQCFYCPFVAVADSNDYCSTLIIAHNRICTENPSNKIQVKEPCTCDSKFSINGPVGHRPDCISQWKEKQSQFPCEHEFIGRDVPDADDIKNYFFRFYCCYKCGLVTCVDPSRSAPSKNPNQ